MQAYKCDRCGRYYSDKAERTVVLCSTLQLNDMTMTGTGEILYKNSKDLCPVCQDQLERWLNRESKKMQQKIRMIETPELNGGFVFK